MRFKPTVTFKVGVNGGIDESKVFAKSEEQAAIALAKKLWSDFGGGDTDAGSCQAAVYGFAEYDPQDPTPSHARTEFWRHWFIDQSGRAHADGR